MSVVCTDLHAYNDALGTWEKCHCNQIVTVRRYSLLTIKSFGTCSKCHCNQGVTVNSVTVTGDICSTRNALCYLQVIVIVVVLVLVGVDDDVGHHAEPDHHRRQEVVRVEAKGARVTWTIS